MAEGRTPELKMNRLSFCNSVQNIFITGYVGEIIVNPQQEDKASGAEAEQINAQEVEVFLLQEKCNLLFNQGKYSDLLPLLKKLHTLQENVFQRLKYQLMIIECILAEKEQSVMVGEQQKEVKKHMDDIIDMLNTSQIRICDITAMQEHYKENGRHVWAIVLTRCVSAAYRKPEEVQERIIEGFGQVLGIVREGLYSAEKKDNILEIGSKFILPTMYQMLEEYRAVDGADPEMKLIGESECLLAIAYCQILLNEYQNSINKCKEGIKLMRMSKRPKHHVLLYLWYIQGAAYHHQGKQTEAESCYENAIESSKKAEDFPNEAEKYKCIVNVSKDLENVRQIKKNVDN